MISSLLNTYCIQILCFCAFLSCCVLFSLFVVKHLLPTLFPCLSEKLRQHLPLPPSRNSFQRAQKSNGQISLCKRPSENNVGLEVICLLVSVTLQWQIHYTLILSFLTCKMGMMIIMLLQRIFVEIKGNNLCEAFHTGNPGRQSQQFTESNNRNNIPPHPAIKPKQRGETPQHTFPILIDQGLFLFRLRDQQK